MKAKQKIFIVILVALLLAFIGSSCIQDAVIPCHIDEGAIEYSEEAAKIYAPYTSIFDAERIKRKMDYVHQMNQEELKRLVVDDDMLYTFLNDSVLIGMADASEIKQAVFDPSGPIAILFPALAGLGLGRYLKSPREVDLEKKVNGKTV